jgi:hypothetical protein
MTVARAPPAWVIALSKDRAADEAGTQMDHSRQYGERLEIIHILKQLKPIMRQPGHRARGKGLRGIHNR